MIVFNRDGGNDMTDIHKDYTNQIIALLSCQWECFNEEEYPHRRMWKLKGSPEGSEVFAEPPDYCTFRDDLEEVFSVLSDEEKTRFIEVLRGNIPSGGAGIITPRAAFDLVNAPTKLQAEALAFVLSQRQPKYEMPE